MTATTLIQTGQAILDLTRSWIVMDFLAQSRFVLFRFTDSLIRTLNSVKRPRSVLRIFPTHTGAPDANRSIPPSKIEWIESMLPDSFLTRKKRV